MQYVVYQFLKLLHISRTVANFQTVNTFNEIGIEWLSLYQSCRDVVKRKVSYCYYGIEPRPANVSWPIREQYMDGLRSEVM